MGLNEWMNDWNEIAEELINKGQTKREIAIGLAIKAVPTIIALAIITVVSVIIFPNA